MLCFQTVTDALVSDLADVEYAEVETDDAPRLDLSKMQPLTLKEIFDSTEKAEQISFLQYMCPVQTTVSTSTTSSTTTSTSPSTTSTTPAPTTTVQPVACTPCPRCRCPKPKPCPAIVCTTPQPIMCPEIICPNCTKNLLEVEPCPECRICPTPKRCVCPRCDKGSLVSLINLMI